MNMEKCPKILDLLLKCGMQTDPKKRPHMKLIFNLLQKLNSVINRWPIGPLQKISDLSKIPYGSYHSM